MTHTTSILFCVFFVLLQPLLVYPFGDIPALVRDPLLCPRLDGTVCADYWTDDVFGYTRHHFVLEERFKAFIVEPHEKNTSTKFAITHNLWAWSMEFPNTEERTGVLDLLSAGYHYAYFHNTGFGSPEVIRRMDVFHTLLTNHSRGFAKQAVLFALSRGGLHAYNYAMAFPHKAAAIYADNPVCDLKSWPGGYGQGIGSSKDWEHLKVAYNFQDDAAALSYKGNPIDDEVDLGKLVAAGIEILHVLGDGDRIVKADENSDILERKYTALGGSIKVIHDNRGHTPHGLHDPSPIVAFVQQAVQRKIESSSWQE